MLLFRKCALTAVRQRLRPCSDLVLQHVVLRHRLEVLMSPSHPTLQPANRLLWS